MKAETNIKNEFSIISFFTVFVIVLNIISVGYGESFISNADFLSQKVKTEYSSDIFTTLGFMLLVGIPATSNISNAMFIYRMIYWIFVLPYLILLGYVFARFIRGIG